MTTLMLFQKGAPDLTNAILILLGVLFGLLILNSLYEWLKSKPWQNRQTPDAISTDDKLQPDRTGNSIGHKNNNPAQSNLLDQQTLNATIG